MKQRKCERGKSGICYFYGKCGECDINSIIVRYEKELKKERKTIKSLFEYCLELENATIFYRNKVKAQGAEEFAEKLKANEYLMIINGFDLSELINVTLKGYRKK